MKGSPFYCYILLFLLSTRSLSAQTLTGFVFDETNAPLPGVQVHILALHKGAITDTTGEFRLEKLPVGIYTVQFSFLGYLTETRQINLSDSGEPLRIVLKPSILNLPNITVTSSPQPGDALSSSQSVASLDKEQLFRNRGDAIMESLEGIAGISTYTTGSGIVKPVIRGLSSQRVLVLINGVRQEGQQWGDEHSPEIDPYSAERIEVVKGPSSVLYGSDALGGVVNVIKPDLPNAQEDPLLGGNINLSGYSNNDLIGGSLALYGAKGTIGYRSSFSNRFSGNLETPEGTLNNTGIEETNGSFMIGTFQNWGEFSVDYSRVNQQLQIFEDPVEDPFATPYQKVQHDRIQTELDLHLNGYRLEVQTSYQNNNRKEFEESDASTPDLNLILKTGTTDIKLHHKPIGNLFGTIGLSGMTQRNLTIANEKLIPEYVLYNLAGFIYEELKIDPFNFSAGLRFDTRNLNVGTTEELGVLKQDLQYNAFSGNLGGVWRISKPFALAINLGRAWRAPTTFELFVDGVHEGTARFEIGDSRLTPESSLNIDVSAKYISATLQSELAVYNNSINNYIFPNPTSQFDAESGFRKYQFTQANALIYGLDYSLQAQTFSWLIVSSGISLVRGTNKLIKNPLPLMPANQLKMGVKFIHSELGIFNDPYLSIDTRVVARQNRIASYETPTGGYALLDIDLGSKIQLGSMNIRVLLQAENILNRAYRSHLNRYKEYALNPGRNVKLKISIPLTITE